MVPRSGILNPDILNVCKNEVDGSAPCNAQGLFPDSALGWPAAVLRGPYAVLGSEPGAEACKTGVCVFSPETQALSTFIPLSSVLSLLCYTQLLPVLPTVSRKPFLSYHSNWLPLPLDKTLNVHFFSFLGKGGTPSDAQG